MLSAGLKEGKPLFSFVVVDSIGAMIGRVEMEKNADEDTVAVVARIVTRMVKHATSFLPRSNAAMLVINQVRANISTTGYGPKVELPGGWALKFCTTLGLQVRGTDKTAPAATIGGERIPVGRYTAIKVERNKVAPAGRVATILLNTVATKTTPVGIDKPDEAFQVGDKLDIITRSGSNYTLPDGSRHNGQPRTIEYLRAHPEVVEEIRQRAIAMHEAEIIEDEPPELPDDPTDDLLEGSEPAEEPSGPPEADLETGEIAGAAQALVEAARAESDSYMDL
jgi:recombination protein RecA